MKNFNEGAPMPSNEAILNTERQLLITQHKILIEQLGNDIIEIENATMDRQRTLEEEKVLLDLEIELRVAMQKLGEMEGASEVSDAA